MIQLFIDYATNKILGYNTIIPQDIIDVVLVEDENLDKLSNIDIFDNLYYENGSVIEKDETDTIYNELKELLTEEAKLSDLVNNENKIFMDNILNDVSIEDAKNVIKENRKKLDGLKTRKKEFENNYMIKRNDTVISKFISEEESIENKYFLSIITTVRDENEYLEEWITYHADIFGVEHFYIYDNESKISVREYLESIQFKYLDKVTVIDWKTSAHTQQDTCNDWLSKYKTDTKWFIVMDVDEFITLKNNSKTLRAFLEENSNFASIKCVWKHYTANGQENKSNEPVRERFTQETTWGDEKHGGKMFAQSNRISHFLSYVPMVRLETSTLDYDNETTTNFFQLNHYITKSYDEWIEKIERGSVNPNYMRKYQEFFEINPDMEYLNTGEKYAQTYCPKTREEGIDIIE